MEIERYTATKSLQGKQVTVTGTFSKYGMNTGTKERSTCLTNVTVNNIHVDHVWINSTELALAKLRSNQYITFNAKLTKRKRPPADLYSETILDIQLVKIKL